MYLCQSVRGIVFASVHHNTFLFLEKNFHYPHDIRQFWDHILKFLKMSIYEYYLLRVCNVNPFIKIQR
jgi:hypothetical protein